MRWRKWPYWLKGGVISCVVYIILILLNETLWIIHFPFVDFQDYIIILPLKIIEFFSGFITEGFLLLPDQIDYITEFILVFLIGAIIGLIVGKIKNKK